MSLSLRMVWFACYTFSVVWINSIDVEAKAGDSGDDLSPIVVELFTSEGCSSCPPADKLLDALRAENVLVLSFHVDYWNRLGWIDPFSGPDATLRQRQYARLFGLDQVYTPQMIVGGESQFVGSDRKKAMAAITTAMRNRSANSLALTVIERRGQLLITYSANKPSNNTRLNLAVVQETAVSTANAGENAGVKLTHANVVRIFRTVDISASHSGSTELEIPDGIDPTSIFVAAYLQDTSTGRIGAATKHKL